MGGRGSKGKTKFSRYKSKQFEAEKREQEQKAMNSIKQNKKEISVLQGTINRYENHINHLKFLAYGRDKENRLPPAEEAKIKKMIDYTKQKQEFAREQIEVKENIIKRLQKQFSLGYQPSLF